jgi:DNA-binding NarL/FixJ family response regulator
MSPTRPPSIRVPLIVFAGQRSVPAQLWKREGTHATIWCREPLDKGLRCDVMLEGISAGVPVLVRIEVTERAEKVENDGVEGHLHLVELTFLRRSDRRTLDVWMRAAQAAQKGKEPRRKQREEGSGAGRKPRPGRPERSAPVALSVFPAGPRQVLLVEGGRSNARKLALDLDPDGRDFVVESIWTLSELKGRLALGRVHLVLLDPELPDSRGLATVQEAVRCAKGVPVVVLLGRGVPGFEVKCLLAGAARVFRKDSMGPELARRLLALLGVSTHPRRRTRPPLPDAASTDRPRPERPRPARSERPRRHPGPRAEVRAVEPPSETPEPAPPKPAPPKPEPEPAPPKPVPPKPEPRPAIQPPPKPPRQPRPAPREPIPTTPQELVAELWWHEDGFAAIWATEALRIGWRCELLLDPEERNQPQLFRVEIVRAHHKRAPDGRNGYLHEAKMHLAPEQPAPPEPAPRPSATARPKAKPKAQPAAASDTPYHLVLVEPGGSGPGPLRRALGRMPGVLVESRTSLPGLRARLRRDGVQLVLLSLELPGANPMENLQQAMGLVGDIPVVAFASDPGPELEAACREAVVQRLLPLGVERAELHALIDELRAG